MVCGAYGKQSLGLPFDEGRGWSRGQIDGIDVIALPLPYSNHDSLARRVLLFVRFALRSAWLALREDYDLLFATSTPLTAAVPGIVMKLCRRGKPFVFEVRDLWPELPRALGMKNPILLGSMSLLEWMGYRTANACIGLSPGIVEGIRRRSRAHLPVAMVPNGCDLELFVPGNREELRIDGIAPADFVATFTGAHGIANGLDALLDAAAELKRRGRSDIKMLFIGDGREKPRLVARAQCEGLANCLFLAPVKKAELSRISGAVDCGLMILKDVPAFYYGTSPNKFFDYLSAGRPVVNNYPGWLADMICEHRCGIAVPPGDPVALADALCRLAADRAGRLEMGRNARALAEAQFAREALAAKFVTTIEKVVQPLPV